MASERSTHMTSPILAFPGAVEATGPDAGVASHYGDPTAEARALAAGRGLVDQSHLGVIRVSGTDRLSWLHSLTTQDLTHLEPGRGVETMVLSPQGRIEHVAAIVDDGDSTWLISETAPALAAHLDRMRFMLRVDVADVTADWAAIGSSGTVERTDGGPPVWVDPWPGVEQGGTSYTATMGGAHPGATRQWSLVLVPRENLGAEFRARIARGAEPVGTWATEAARIAAWRPRAATEVDSTSLPHELDWLRTAVHLHKGCYRGQETVAKVHNVGRPPRRLVFLHLDGSGHVLPERGSAVSFDNVPVGVITSVALHHEDGPIALALLKRSTAPTAELTVAGSEAIAATQVPIVNPEGFSDDRPPPPGPTARGLLMGRGCAADGGDLIEPADALA